MIIARITTNGKPICMGSVEITGSPADGEYRTEGWFPVESFGIGTAPKEEKKPEAKDGKSQPTNQPVKLPTTNQKSDERQGFTTQIKKEVDYATPFLMLRAMKERSRKKSTSNKDEVLEADIHVLGSVAYKDTKERFVYPSLMIHMEMVHVEDWSVDGSGNSRPSESFKLKYDKAAIRYCVTPDGVSFDPQKAVGWDQDANEEWTDDIDELFEKYLPKPKYV